MPRHWLKNSALIWLLVLMTTVWGTVAAAHNHLDTDASHCEVCALPHSGAAGTIIETVVLPPLSDAPLSLSPYSYGPVALPPYQGRAPPA